MMRTHSEPRDNRLPSWTLDIAGLRLAVVSGAAGLSRAIEQRFVDYVDSGPPNLVVRVNVTDAAAIGAASGTAPADLGSSTGTHERTRFSGRVLLHDAPGRTGRVDVDGGEAEVWVAAAQALDHTDYFLRLCVALLAFDAGGLLLHAAGVVRDGIAHAFIGPSGSGKTTVARHAAPGRILNDDLIVLRPSASGWYAHATPFSNPTQVAPGGPHRAPLGGIYRLVHGTVATLEAVDIGTAVADVVASVPVIGLDPDRAGLLVARAHAVARAVPVRRLHCRPDPSFWPLIASPADLAEQGAVAPA